MKKKNCKMPQTANLDLNVPDSEIKKAKGFLSAHLMDSENKIKITDKEFIERYANDDDLRELRERIEAKREKVGWRILPDNTRIPGDMILHGCQARGCGYWFWLRPGSDTCPRCFQKKLRPATKKEEKAWFERETARIKKYFEDLPKRQELLRQFNMRQFQDMGNPSIQYDPTIRTGRG